MVQPIQYVTPGAFDPFNSLMQGVRLGVTFEEMQAARQQREMQQQQMLMQQDMVRAQQQALQQKAMQEQARQEELARLQAIPYEQMTKEQALRMMDLTQSEATRAHIARRLEAIPAEKRQTLARDYGSTLIALTMSPEVGVRRLRENAQVQTDPAEKKALEDAVRIAELDPMLAARTIHGMMHMSQDPTMVKIAESATRYLETAGKPLYPKAVPPKEAATIVSTDADKTRLGLVENGRPLPGVWAIEPGKAPQQLRPEVARAVGGAGGGAAKPQEAAVNEFERVRQKAQPPKYDAQAGGFIIAPTDEKPQGDFIPLRQVSNLRDQAAAVKALRAAGYDPETGEDRVSKLIERSTGGAAQTLAAKSLEFWNITTPGQKAIGELQAAASAITTDMLGGKLGAGISNTDREFILQSLGDVGNSLLGTGRRLQAWTAARNRMITAGMVPPPTKPPKSQPVEQIRSPEETAPTRGTDIGGGFRVLD